MHERYRSDILTVKAVSGAQIITNLQTTLRWVQSRRRRSAAPANPPNPESTEGGCRGSVLKRQEGAPALLGKWFWNREHPIDAAT